VFAFVGLDTMNARDWRCCWGASNCGAKDSRLKAIVVGGSGSGIAPYRECAAKSGLNGRLKLSNAKGCSAVSVGCGCVDAAVLLRSISTCRAGAAAAGLPCCDALNGVEEFLRDGENGLLMQRTCLSFRRYCAIRWMSVEARRSMGRRAQMDVKRYGLAEFVSAGRELFGRVAPCRMKRCWWRERCFGCLRREFCYCL